MTGRHLRDGHDALVLTQLARTDDRRRTGAENMCTGDESGDVFRKIDCLFLQMDCRMDADENITLLRIQHELPECLGQTLF